MSHDHMTFYPFGGVFSCVSFRVYLSVCVFPCVCVSFSVCVSFRVCVSVQSILADVKLLGVPLPRWRIASALMGWTPIRISDETLNGFPWQLGFSARRWNDDSVLGNVYTVL